MYWASSLITLTPELCVAFYFDYFYLSFVLDFLSSDFDSRVCCCILLVPQLSLESSVLSFLCDFLTSVF